MMKKKNKNNKKTDESEGCEGKRKRCYFCGVETPSVSCVVLCCGVVAVLLKERLVHGQEEESSKGSRSAQPKRSCPRSGSVQVQFRVSRVERKEGKNESE